MKYSVSKGNSGGVVTPNEKVNEARTIHPFFLFADYVKSASLTNQCISVMNASLHSLALSWAKELQSVYILNSPENLFNASPQVCAHTIPPPQTAC